jgi:hypothetical protein
VVYFNPSDYPGRYVVRVQRPGPGGAIQEEAEPRAVVDTLEEARKMLPWYLTNLGRYPDDDPVIVEVWV